MERERKVESKREKKRKVESEENRVRGRWRVCVSIS